MKRERIVVVLVHPRRQGNVGAAARAMKNCGLRELRIVGGRRCGKEAKRFAVHAEDVLAGAKRFRNLEAAVDDAARIVGFSSKSFHDGPKPEPLPELVGDLRAASERGTVALVFGREDHGLLKDEIRLCTDLARIPADPGYPVLNLSQAVLLAGYEIVLASRTTGARRSVSSTLPRSRRQRLVAEFRGLLAGLAFEKPRARNRSARILQRLSSQFDRALAEEADLQLWLGLLQRIKQRI